MYTANRQAGDVQALDTFALQARARALRAEAVATFIGNGLFAAGRALRKGWYRLEQNRLDRALRRELSRLDAHTLRDLGLNPSSISAVTSDSLADHPLARQGLADAPANENKRREEIRTAA